MPVFVTWLIQPFGQPTRSRSWLTSSGVASHHLPEPGGLIQRCSAALLGLTTLASRFAHHDSEEPLWTASRLRKTNSSGASYRPTPLPLPKELQHCLPAEIGPLVTCRARLPLPALGEAGTAVPITKSPCTCPPSRESEKWGEKPVDNGDIGNNRRNLLAAERSRLGRLPFRSPPPTAAKCLNRLRQLQSPPISAG